MADSFNFNPFVDGADLSFISGIDPSTINFGYNPQSGNWESYTPPPPPAPPPSAPAPQGGGGGGTPAPAASTFNPNIEAMKQFFQRYGLDALWEGARSYLVEGYTDPSVISVMLSNNKQYQEAYYARFPAVKLVRDANDQRKAQGLAPIPEPSPASYVALEEGYRQALNGLPDGLYGGPADVAKWIVDEVSPQEIADRVGVAKNYINYQANPFVKDALRQVYGLSDTEMVAYALDDDGRTSEFLQTEYNRRMAQANVQGAANAVGLNGLGTNLRDQIAATGYGSNFDSSAAVFTNVLNQNDAYTRLGRVYNADTSTSELVVENFGLGGAAEVTTKKKKLASQERAAFMGSSAVARGSLTERSLGQQ